MKNYKYVLASGMASAMITLVGCVAPGKMFQGVREIRNGLDIRP